MSTGHRFLTDYGKAISAGGDYVIDPPSSGGTFVQRGLAFGTSTVGAGTYILPDNGKPMYVRATGTATIQSEAATTIAVIPSGGLVLFVPLSATTWAGVYLSSYVSRVLELPNTKYTTSATTTTVVPGAGALTGARRVYWENTADGALGLTTRTAALLFGDIPGAYLGLSFELVIVNRGNNTITITGGTDVNLTGENTIATLVTRTYACEFEDNGIDGGPALTMTSVNKGTIET